MTSAIEHPIYKDDLRQKCTMDLQFLLRICMRLHLCAWRRQNRSQSRRNSSPVVQLCRPKRKSHDLKNKWASSWRVLNKIWQNIQCWSDVYPCRTIIDKKFANLTKKSRISDFFGRILFMKKIANLTHRCCIWSKVLPRIWPVDLLIWPA